MKRTFTPDPVEIAGARPRVSFREISETERERGPDAMAPNQLLHQLLSSIACLMNEFDNLVTAEFTRQRETAVLTNAHRISNLVVEFQNFLRSSREDFCAHETVGGCAERADARFLSRAIGVTERNLSDIEFGIDKMAKELAVSRRQLYRKIKSALNCTPNDFIRLLRLNRAAKLLGNSSMTVAEITHAVGFSDLKYFRTIFREHFGVLPKNYSRKTAQCGERTNEPALLADRHSFGEPAKRDAFPALSLPSIPESPDDFRHRLFTNNYQPLSPSFVEGNLELK
jgi:AraC-like DNA-binding protein